MQTGTFTPPITGGSRLILKIGAGIAAVALLLPFVATAWHQALGAPLPYPLHVVLTRLPILFPVHMAASGTALLLVPLAIASRLVPRHHAAMGRLAVVAIGGGGLTALAVATASIATPAARLAFFAQGLAWLLLAAAGIIAIRRKHKQLHVRLMIATTIVTFAPVVLRLSLGMAVRHHWPFALAYAALAWTSWLAPLGLYGLFLATKDFAARLPQLVGALQMAAPE